jgi:serine/threonine protein kinase
MRVVNKDPTNPFVVKYMGHRLFRDERAFRFAMPFAEFGDMGAALYKWTRHNLNGRLPKAFLLDCFAALATACKLLTERNMLHNDLKHINVLMVADPDGDMRQFAHEADKKTKGWGVKPVLVDFGLAQPIKSDAFENPRSKIGLGTTGWRPPEQVENGNTRQSLPLPDERVGEKAMVFMVGATMFSLLHPLQHVGNLRQFGDPSHDASDEYVNLYNTVYDDDFDDLEYVGEHFKFRKNICVSRTHMLNELITDCLRLKLDDRPDFDEVPKELIDSEKERELEE